MAVVMVLYNRGWNKHYGQFLMIAAEWLTIKDPKELSRIAAERKPNMMLLPYGIPICIGSIADFHSAGMIDYAGHNRRMGDDLDRSPHEGALSLSGRGVDSKA